jgi:hypothetical protein
MLFRQLAYVSIALLVTDITYHRLFCYVAKLVTRVFKELIDARRVADSGESDNVDGVCHWCVQPVLLLLQHCS